MRIEERKKEILSGFGMNYLYMTDEMLSIDIMLGTILRALGHEWKVGVITDNHQTILTVNKLAKKTKQKRLFINEMVDDLRLLVVDSIDDLKMWRKKINKKTHLVALNIDGDFDLVTKVEVSRLRKKGVVAVTGEGKGKTTIALGRALLRSLSGDNALVISWFKERKNEGLSWRVGEHLFEKNFGSKKFAIKTTGLGFFGSPNLDRVKGDKSYEAHCAKAREGVVLAKEAISKGGGLIVLDEFVDTVKEIAGNIDYPLLNLEEARELLMFGIESHKSEIIVTGRRVNNSWDDLISTSIVLKSVKHPWRDMGLSAVMGLDY